MPASSLQVLPCSSQIVYRLSDTIFVMLSLTSKVILQASLFRDQWRQLILLPLSKLSSDSSPSSYVLVINALDECDRDKHIRIILLALS